MFIYKYNYVKKKSLRPSVSFNGAGQFPMLVDGACEFFSLKFVLSGFIQTDTYMLLRWMLVD